MRSEDGCGHHSRPPLPPPTFPFPMHLITDAVSITFFPTRHMYSLSFPVRLRNFGRSFLKNDWLAYRQPAMPRNEGHSLDSRVIAFGLVAGERGRVGRERERRAKKPLLRCVACFLSPIPQRLIVDPWVDVTRTFALRSILLRVFCAQSLGPESSGMNRSTNGH